LIAAETEVSDQEAGLTPPVSTIPVNMSLATMERKMIEATLERFQGHRQKSAEALGIGVRTLTNKLREYGYAPREKTYISRETRAA
ncbi:MAG: helix-turn-helix domain-containing protein, partial [Pirellulaceae bacterium]|nr:helix-turn-helix domain-containing protein [Pirellulaceae bacterium]